MKTKLFTNPKKTSFKVVSIKGNDVKMKYFKTQKEAEKYQINLS